MTTQNKPLQIYGEILSIGNESVGENYTKNDFLLQIAGQYPYQIYFICFGVTCEALKRCAVGDSVTVIFAISSREHKGKYFTEAKAYKIEIDYKAAAAKKEGANEQ